MAITTGTDHQHSPHPKDHHHQQQEHEPDRKLLTKAAHQIFHQRPSRGCGRGVPGRVICILLIFAIKIVATAGNAIRNIDHHQIIINDTSSDTSRTSATAVHPLIGDLSIRRPQNQPLQQQMGQQERHLPLGQLNQDERFATDASRESLTSSSSWGRAASYSYFYIGRKLIYVPLFFLLYWTIYNMVLLVQSIVYQWVSVRGRRRRL